MTYLDPVKNFAIVTVNTGYDASATSIALSSGQGAKLPAPSTDGAFNLVWWNFTDYPNPADDPNVEIVRATARSTDTLTVTRAQEGTSASTKNTGGKTYKMALALTQKTITDIESSLQGKTGTAIASATTTNIGASAGQNVHITGTTTITGFGTADAGVFRRVEFDGALTLTHNATSLILPGNANITTAAGDVAYFVSLGSGNWKCEAYNKKSGEAVVSGGGVTGDVFIASITEDNSGDVDYLTIATSATSGARVYYNPTGSFTVRTTPTPRGVTCNFDGIVAVDVILNLTITDASINRVLIKRYRPSTTAWTTCGESVSQYTKDEDDSWTYFPQTVNAVIPVEDGDVIIVGIETSGQTVTNVDTNSEACAGSLRILRLI